MVNEYKRISIYVPKDLAEKIKELSEKEHRSISSQIVHLLQNIFK